MDEADEAGEYERKFRCAVCLQDLRRVDVIKHTLNLRTGRRYQCKFCGSMDVFEIRG